MLVPIHVGEVASIAGTSYLFFLKNIYVYIHVSPTSVSVYNLEFCNIYMYISIFLLLLHLRSQRRSEGCAPSSERDAAGPEGIFFIVFF